MKFLHGLLIAVLFTSCLSDEQQAEITSALDTPTVQESEVDTFVVGGRTSLTSMETVEGESLRLENDTAMENIRQSLIGNNPGVNLEPDPGIVRNPDVGPSFPGGTVAMDNYIQSHLVYPLVAFQNEITGTVNVRFVVETDGKLTGIIVQKGLGYGCDESAVDLIKSMPKWVAGKKGGVNVRCSVVLPIAFRTPE